MPKINVSREVEELERELRSENDPAHREHALAILRRWQFDEMLDDVSRQKAKRLVREFADVLRL